MYAGHFAIALMGKGLRQELSLPMVVAASLGCDLVMVGQNLVMTGLLGISGFADPMWHHSIPAAALIALAFSGMDYVVGRKSGRAVFVGLIALSHVVLDYITAVLPTWPGGPTVGLDLYRFPLIDLLLETTLILAGWVVSRKSLSAKVRGSWPVYAILVLLVAIQVVFDVLPR